MAKLPPSFQRQAEVEAKRIKRRKLRPGESAHAVIAEDTKEAAKNIRSGPLGPLLTEASDAEVVVRVKAHDSAGKGAGAAARAAPYAEVRKRVLAAWDSLPTHKKSKRGARKWFALDAAEKYGVKERTVLDWIANRP